MMLLSCCCGCKEKEVEVDELENVTNVLSWDGASTIAPYAREVQDCGFSTTCGTPVTEPACAIQGFDYSTLSEPWVVSGIVAGAGANDQVENNYYKLTGAKVAVGNPCGYGWKAVASKAVWAGMKGFDVQECCVGDPMVGGQTQVRYMVKRTKQVMWYRDEQQVVVSGSDCTDYVWGTSVTYEQLNTDTTETVDRDGNQSGSGTVEYVSTQDTPGNPLVIIQNCNRESWATGAPPCFIVNAVGVPLFRDAVPTGDCGVVEFGCGADKVTGTPAAINALDKWGPLPDGVSTTPCVGCTPGTQTTTIKYTFNPLRVSLSNTKVTAAYSGVYTEAITGCDNLPIGNSRKFEYFVESEVTLTGENTFQSVVDDAIALLGEWDLTDHKKYPWRTDAQTWLVPFVSRDAAPNNPGSGGFDTATCQMVNNPPQYSGDIRGSPLPTGGYAPFYNFFHKNYYGDQGIYCASCISSIGATNPLTAAATQWTNLQDGVAMFGPGAWLLNYDVSSYFAPSGGAPSGGPYVIAQKWAETLEAWPRASPVRPCGRDRYLFDEANVGCVASWVDPTVVTETPVALSGTVVMGSELYTVTGGSGDTYTLVAQGITTPVPCDGIANLRFAGARGICGRLVATAVQTSPGLVTITTPANYLRTNDTVTIAGIGGITGGAVTVVDSTSFTIAGTVTTPLVGWVHNVGITSATWDLEAPCSEHKYVVATAQSDGADPTDYTFTDDTLAPSSSYPSVLYCTPNGEVFPHGKSYPFGDIGPDLCYGSFWGLNFYQAVADPYWQQPHVPCDYVSGGWTMTSDPCGVQDANTYPFPPLVEPVVGMSTLPAGFGGGGYTGCYAPLSRAPAHAYRADWLTCNTKPGSC